MPKADITKQIEQRKVEVGKELAELYIQLTGHDRRVVAVGIRQSEDTVYRYSTEGVKKLAVGQMMLEKMKEVIASRSSEVAA